MGGEKDKRKGSGGGTSKSNVTACVHVYLLMAEERGLLNEHSSCYQCRRVYVDHRAVNCPEKGKALTLEDYSACRLTPEMAATAQAAFAKKSKVVGGVEGGSVTVAAVFEELSDDDEGSDASSEYVFPQHMTLVSAPSIAPTSVKRVLIDTRAPPAMISLTLVNKLRLPMQRLSWPLEVSGVFLNGMKESVQVMDYIKLVILSPCTCWKSHSQMFVVCKDLHTDMILGLNFLKRNKITVNLETESVVCNNTNFDLLHLPKVSVQEEKVAPHIRHRLDKVDSQREWDWIHEGQKEAEVLWKPVLFELNALFVKESEKFAQLSEHTSSGEPMMLGLVRARVEELAFQANLAAMDEQMKKKFKAQFPSDILHAEQLLD
ncbi:hypothetical protein C0992_005659, partial [Termitomyces sp. T32_za158]